MNFLEKLEKNYGVFLDASNFIDEIRQKIGQIKTYSDLYKYIRCTLIKSDDVNSEIDIISDAYSEAKIKEYI